MSIQSFIEAIRATDSYIQDIYMNGGCYQFAVLLCKMYRGCEIYMNGMKDHCIVKNGCRFYDIRGEVPFYETMCFHPITDEERKRAEQWSFSRNYRMKIAECPHCEEPITWPPMDYQIDNSTIL